MGMTTNTSVVTPTSVIPTLVIAEMLTIVTLSAIAGGVADSSDTPFHSRAHCALPPPSPSVCVSSVSVDRP
eukprot:9044326-Heterocapsa_arctica.AAC.1